MPDASGKTSTAAVRALPLYYRMHWRVRGKCVSGGKSLKWRETGDARPWATAGFLPFAVIFSPVLQQILRSDVASDDLVHLQSQNHRTATSAPRLSSTRFIRMVSWHSDKTLFVTLNLERKPLPSESAFFIKQRMFALVATKLRCDQMDRLMLSKGQGVTISGFASLICINVASVIWRWPDYHVFAWFALIWLAVAYFTCIVLILNKDRLWSFAALVVFVFAFFINCSYLNAITAQV